MTLPIQGVRLLSNGALLSLVERPRVASIEAVDPRFANAVHEAAEHSADIDAAQIAEHAFDHDLFEAEASEPTWDQINEQLMEEAAWGAAYGARFGDRFGDPDEAFDLLVERHES